MPLSFCRFAGSLWCSLAYRCITPISDLTFTWLSLCVSSVQFSRSIVSESLWSHGLQQTGLPCSSLSPGVCSNSCPLSQWCHPTISSCRPLHLLPSTFHSIKIFSNESVLRIRWPKFWSFTFSISSSNEYSGMISFRIDWLDLLAVQGTLKSPLQPHNSKASIFWHSVFFTYGPILSSIHDYCYSFDYVNLCQ